MKKLIKKLYGIVMSLSIILSTFMPGIVYATEYGEGDKMLSVNITNALSGATYSGLKVNNQAVANSSDVFKTSDGNYTIAMDVTSEKTPKLQTGGNWNGKVTQTSTQDGTKYSFTLTVTDAGIPDYTFMDIRIEEATNDPQNDPQNPPPIQSDFDGRTTLIWTCGASENEICYKQLTGLSSTEVNWIKGSTIEAENKAGVKFDVHAKEKFFSPQDLFESKKDDIDNGVIKVGDLVGPDGLDYMPVGEPTENNALVSYGNRQFKAVVYGDEFKGITIGDLDSLDYYPQAWNDWFLRRETYDMSGTTKENPVEIDTLLLQKKINLKLQTDLNSYNVTKIEALDVPSDAVIITKKNDGSYDLDFKSNFYDKVVFKVTTDDNKEQFIYINRRTTDPWIRTDNGKEGLVVETFYDRNKSYSDLDVIAKIVNKDGSSKVVHLEAEKGIDNKLGDIIDDYEVDEQTVGNESLPKGKGMKRANFVYAMSKADLKKVDKIYINVGFKGSTETTYAGNFAGSGKGDVIDMKNWEDRL